MEMGNQSVSRNCVDGFPNSRIADNLLHAHYFE